MSLRERSVLVAGGARAGSLARELSVELARRGAALAVTARTKGGLSGADAVREAALAAGGAPVLALAADASDADSLARCVLRAEEGLGGLDGFVFAGQAAAAGTSLARVKPSQLEAAWKTGPAALAAWLAACHEALSRSRGSVVVYVAPDFAAQAAGCLASMQAAACRALASAARAEWAGEGVSCELVEALCETAALEDLRRRFPDAAREFSRRAAGGLCSPADLACRVAGLLGGGA